MGLSIHLISQQCSSGRREKEEGRRALLKGSPRFKKGRKKGEGADPLSFPYREREKERKSSPIGSH